ASNDTPFGRRAGGGGGEGESGLRLLVRSRAAPALRRRDLPRRAPGGREPRCPRSRRRSGRGARRRAARSGYAGQSGRGRPSARGASARHPGPATRRSGGCEARPPAAAPLRRGGSAAPVKCVLALCLACWGCGGAPEWGISLFHRADGGAAQLEDQLLTPYRARHPGLEVLQHNAALPPAEYRRLLLTAVASETLPDVFQLDDVDVP